MGRVMPWAGVAAVFALWFAAMAAMAAFPEEHAKGERVSLPTGMLVLYQDPRSQQTVALRDTRSIDAGAGGCARRRGAVAANSPMM
jgi:hypothetical protein